MFIENSLDGSFWEDPQSDIYYRIRKQLQVSQTT